MEQKPRKVFQFRAFVSLLAAVCFGMAVLSGAVLFLAPSGRGAGRTWFFWGLNRHQWEEQHIWFCVIFTVAGIVHLVLNIRPMLHYLRIIGSKTYRFRIEWLAALAVGVMVFAGTYYGWKPFRAVLEYPNKLRRSPQTSGDNLVVRGGQQTPPRMGQMTLVEYCRQEGIKTEEVIQQLQTQGLTVLPEMTMREIADLAGVHPSQLREMLDRP